MNFSDSLQINGSREGMKNQSEEEDTIDAIEDYFRVNALTQFSILPRWILS